MPKEFEAKVKEVIQRAPNVKSIRLELPERIDFQAGQFCCVWLKPLDAFKRYLSISSSPTEKGYLEFTKKLTQSDFSKILDKLKPLDTVRIQYPFGKFILNQGYSKIAFLSGGIGITPIRSICKYAVDKNIGTDIILVYANRSIRDIVFGEDFEAMQKEYPKLKVAHVLCEPAPGFKCTAGLINATVIKNEVPDFLSRKFYLCGPPAMVESMSKILRSELNIAQESIITENFRGY